MSEFASMTMAKTDGQLLAELINDLDITKTKLANRIGVNRATIYTWLGDKNKGGMSSDHWFLIGKKFSVDISKYKPKLKRHEEKLYPTAELTPDRVAELEEKYQGTQKDVDFLKSQLNDYRELIDTKNELIETYKDQLVEAKKEIEELKRKLR